MDLYRLHHKFKVNEPLLNSEHSPSNDGLLDSQKPQQHTLRRARAWTYVKRITPSWKTGRKKLAHMRPHNGPTHGYMKCFAYEEFYVNSPWSLGAGCRSMQTTLNMTTRKTMNTKLQWLDGKALHIPPTRWFLELVIFKMILKENIQGSYLHEDLVLYSF